MELMINPHELSEHYQQLKALYIKLLHEKEHMISCGQPQLEAIYMTQLGVWQVKQLQVQLRIQALKLKLEKVRSCIARQIVVDVLAIEMDVAAMLVEAEEKILEETEKIAAANRLLDQCETPERSKELRKLFCEYAKLLHPDVNVNVTEQQLLLWHKIKLAYENCDLEQMKALGLAYEDIINGVQTAVSLLLKDEIKSKMEQLKKGIQQLQEEISALHQLFPFSIADILFDEIQLNKAKEELIAELNKLTAYEETLTHKYQQLIASL